jgi:cardiolipin synthase
MNIGDEYQGRKKRYAPWRDTHVRIAGPAVLRLQEIFAEDWHFETGEDLVDPAYFPRCPPAGDDLVQVIESGPDMPHENIYAVVFTAVTRARKRIQITTPYFVPGAALLTALKGAAWRGVDVRILLPGRVDLKLVQAAGRSYHEELLEAGVRLYEHGHGMLHAKTLVVDGIWSSVGSANMDIRSFRLNFESNVLVTGQDFAEQLETIFERDVARARELTLEMMAQKPHYRRLVEGLARVLSPVL